MNLMLNAIEAMKDSGGELTVKSERQDGQLQFSVSDTGVGLPTENMDQIFSAFFTTKSQGSGMGLAISRSIVESHGGRLWASANEEGAQLFISPYRSRSRSHRPWLPETPSRQLTARFWCVQKRSRRVFFSTLPELLLGRSVSENLTRRGSL